MNIRQIALATAEIYLTRFLTRVSLKEINVYLLVTTCIYVACKIEECPQHIRLIISEARNLWPEYIPHDVTKLAEFEFYLIEEMELFLFLHHPYKSLTQLKAFLAENTVQFGFTLNDEELQNCWSLINDSYITDLHLLFPPHIIAVASIYITIVLKRNSSVMRGNSNLNFSTSQKNNNNALNSGINNDNNNDCNNNKIYSNDNGTTSTNESTMNPSNSNAITNNQNNEHENTNSTSTMHIGDLMTLANNNNSQNVSSSRNGSTSNINTTSANDNLNNITNNNAINNTSSNNVQAHTSTSSTNNNGSHAGLDATHFQDIKLDEDTIKINKFMNFLNRSHINLDEVVESMQDMINLYVVWNRYNENNVRKALQYMLLNR